MPKLSIVTLCYNQEKEIANFLDCFLKFKILSPDDIEIIIVDDGSTDDSFNVIKNYQKEYNDFSIQLLHNGQNKNQSMARNIGTKHCVGEYISYWDCDDIYEPIAVKSLIKKLIGNDIYLHNFIKQKEICNGKVSNKYSFKKYQNFTTATLKHMAIIGSGCSTHTLIINRSYLRDIDVFWDEEKYFWDAEDTYFGIQVIDKTIDLAFIGINIPTLIHYKNIGSNSDRRGIDNLKYNYYLIDMYENLKMICKDPVVIELLARKILKTKKKINKIIGESND